MKSKKFFAAANSYEGFISYFDRVFDPRNFDRLYIIKGGPGTGKSSLMKRITYAAKELNIETEDIYCSSDPDSLDGIIIENKKKRIGFLDGTAPHLQDTVFPGAVDAIINLGDNWSDKWLIAQKDKIIQLSEEKKSAYRRAYFYLSISGMCRNEISIVEKMNISKNNLNSIVKCLAEMINYDKGERCIRLISSFGKNGKHTIYTPDNLADKIYSLKGSYETKKQIMKKLNDMLLFDFARFTAFIDPLDKELIEAIYLPQCDTLITASEGGNEFDVSSAEKPLNEAEILGLSKANAIHNESLLESQRWFNIAAQIHAELEYIYSSSMNFEGNERILNEKTSEIMDMLS